VVPAFIGGVALSGLADRLPRRQMMIGADLASGVFVAVMALPGVPLVLLSVVTMIGAVFLAGRVAIYPDILEGDRYVVGTAVTMTSVMVAQFIGFASGGIAVGLLGVRPGDTLRPSARAAGAVLSPSWRRV
jgi:predicted MFS family arabinose efflux permease